MASEIKHSIEENEHIPLLRTQPTEECRTVLDLEGMTCASCAMRIEKGLKKVPGVADAQVNLATERGTVTYDPGQASIDQMLQKVEAIGYKATQIEQAAPTKAQANDVQSVIATDTIAQSTSNEDERAK